MSTQDLREGENISPSHTNSSEDLHLCPYYDDSSMSETEHLRRLEEEQDQLNSSLIALTTHFAQVQFRLKQIVDAGSEDKEILLKDLEEFAFRGIPNISQYETTLDLTHILDEKEHNEKMEEQRVKQKELINKLKEQLEDLEHYAYATGDAGMPQSMLLERQSVIIEQFKGKLQMNLDELDKLSPEELRIQVDTAIKELINPAKMKEQLVGQLKTQIIDLERFIEFLQDEGTSNRKPTCTCDCPVHSTEKETCTTSSNGCASKPKPSKKSNRSERTSHIFVAARRALTVLHMFALSQLFTCGQRQEFQRNTLKQSKQGNHYGDLRARLEVAVNLVEKIIAEQETSFVDSDYTSDSDEIPTVQCYEKLTTAVRKDLCSAIRDLMQHGLAPVNENTSIVPFGCLPVRSAASSKMMHAWDLVLKYYELKNGHEFNASAARKLCQSFNLEIVGGVAVTPKHSLLHAIGSIISTHTRLKRSADSHLKALISAALNEKCLTSWFRLIYKTRVLIASNYQPWSYATTTGFDDALQSLDRLSPYKFSLPVDLAVHQLQNIQDAF